MSIVADVLIGILLLFSVRRLLWVLASWLRRRTPTEAGLWPDVLVAVAFRNEEDSLPHLLSSLDALNYDANRLSICLVDDASTDASAGLAVAWARERGSRRLITLGKNVGKAEALNRALASAAGKPEVMVVYDADQCPLPNSLRRLIEPFVDQRTEAVCGYRRPVFLKINAIVAYGCLEAWTHQLINLAAKDVLGLNPPTMGGNCASRRSALERIGGFPVGSFSEDIEVHWRLPAVVERLDLSATLLPIMLPPTRSGTTSINGSGGAGGLWRPAAMCADSKLHLWRPVTLIG